jgi:hypothetical protein
MISIYKTTSAEDYNRIMKIKTKEITMNNKTTIEITLTKQEALLLGKLIDQARDLANMKEDWNLYYKLDNLLCSISEALYEQEAV